MKEVLHGKPRLFFLDSAKYITDSYRGTLNFNKADEMLQVPVMVYIEVNSHTYREVPLIKSIWTPKQASPPTVQLHNYGGYYMSSNRIILRKEGIIWTWQYVFTVQLKTKSHAVWMAVRTSLTWEISPFWKYYLGTIWTRRYIFWVIMSDPN